MTDFDTNLPAMDADDLASIMQDDQDGPTRKTRPEPIKPPWAVVKLPAKLAHTSRPAKRIFYDYSEVNNAIRLIRKLPGPNETVHAVMDGRFKGIDLLPAVLKIQSQAAEEVIITTLGFNRHNVACMCELFTNRQIKRLAMVCSVYFAETDRPAYDYARERFSEINCQLTTSRNHTKLMLFDFGRTFYTVESSANLRSCNNFEQFNLTNSRDVWKFHRGWVTRMLR